MSTDDTMDTPSKAAVWGGRVMGGLPALFLLMGGVMSITKNPASVEGLAKAGYPEGVLVPLGIVLSISVILYLLPRTAILGAILLTGYLGGAVDSHVHSGDDLVHMSVAPLFGVLIWGGLWLQRRTLRSMFPVR